MYFPSDMNFQYFFFDTYIGYFLQALPISLIVSVIYGYIKFRKDKNTPLMKKIFSFLFICYITGLLCLVIGFDLMHIFYYNLFYQVESSIGINWFSGEIDLMPDFLDNINSEVIGNFLMFLPFDILYPLSKENNTFVKTLITEIKLIILIELLHPVFDRAFDINDIILNTINIVISTLVFTITKRLINK